MKKTLIISTAFVLSAGALSSQIKVRSEAVVPAIKIIKTAASDRKDLASGD